MSKALKLSAWRAGILILLLGLVVWRNFFFYPRVWNARITVDSAVCRDCAVYVGRGRIGGVLIRRAEQQVEFYSVAFPNPDLEVPNGAVWKCNAGTLPSRSCLEWLFTAWPNLMRRGAFRPLRRTCV